MAKSLAVEPNRWTPLDNLHYYESDPDTYYTLFENHRTLPHAWCVWRATQLDESQALQAIRNGQLADGATFDPTTTAVMDAPLPAAWSDHSPQHAEVTLDHPVAPRRLLVRTPDTCLLVIAEVFYPWWRAQIDGKSADVYRVNHAMIGVAVPPGSHVVSLALRPTSVWIGGTISIVSLVIAIVIVAGGKGQRRRAPTVTGAPVGSQ